MTYTCIVIYLFTLSYVLRNIYTLILCPLDVVIVDELSGLEQEINIGQTHAAEILNHVDPGPLEMDPPDIKNFMASLNQFTFSATLSTFIAESKCVDPKSRSLKVTH